MEIDISHSCKTGLIDQINNKLHLTEYTQNTGISRIVSRFYKCLKAVLFLVVMWLMGWDMLDLKDWVCRAGGFLRNLLFPTKDALPAEEDVPDLEEPKRIGFFSNLFHKAEEQEQEAEAVQASEAQNTQNQYWRNHRCNRWVAETPIPPQEPPTRAVSDAV